MVAKGRTVEKRVPGRPSLSGLDLLTLGLGIKTDHEEGRDFEALEYFAASRIAGLETAPLVPM